MPPVADAIEALLSEQQGLTLVQVMRHLRRDPATTRLSRREVEAALQRDARFVAETSLSRTSWHLDQTMSTGSSLVSTYRETETPVPTVRPLDGLDLFDWQVDAFGAWAGAGCRGVIEAVTGTGKTRIGIAAVRVALSKAGRVLILVPTIDLMDQWQRRLREHVPRARIGRLGGGRDDDLHTHDVVIATPQSAAGLPIAPPPGALGLLIADEAHRYGAPTWGEALKAGFGMRLALTATYERNDEGLEQILGPYFGGVVCSYGYARAAADATIAPFRVAFVATELEEPERDRYDQADARVKRYRRELVGCGLPPEPRALFAAAAQLVARAEGRPGRGVDHATAAARGFLSATRARRDVAATCAGKLDVLAKLAVSLADHRTLVFTDTVEQAEHAARLLSRAGTSAEELHGDLPEKRRRIRLAQFANGNLSALTAPRVLDEGIDVPEADVAVVLSAFRTRRQMVQRLGRVLRVKPDGREARLVVVYAAATREDPAEGAHADFIEEIVPVARSVQRLHADEDETMLRAWIDSPDRETAPAS